MIDIPDISRILTHKIRHGSFPILNSIVISFKKLKFIKSTLNDLKFLHIVIEVLGAY